MIMTLKHCHGMSYIAMEISHTIKVIIFIGLLCMASECLEADSKKSLKVLRKFVSDYLFSLTLLPYCLYLISILVKELY